LNTLSQSVLTIIHHVLERLQRDFVKNLPDRSKQLVFPGEMLCSQVLFQVTEQKEIARCEVGGIRWLRVTIPSSCSGGSSGVMELFRLFLRFRTNFPYLGHFNLEDSRDNRSGWCSGTFVLCRIAKK
jgi:hypothetical protein